MLRLSGFTRELSHPDRLGDGGAATAVAMFCRRRAMAARIHAFSLAVMRYLVKVSSMIRPFAGSSSQTYE